MVTAEVVDAAVNSPSAVVGFRACQVYVSAGEVRQAELTVPAFTSTES